MNGTQRLHRNLYLSGIAGLLLAVPVSFAAPQNGPQTEPMPAHVHHHDPAATAISGEGETTPPGPSRIAIPDVVVTDQKGDKVRFYSDLIRGRTVAVNFIFTTCTTICPPLTANFARVQKTLLERGKTDVRFISVSVDPEGDTPEKMKSYAELFHAQPGWTFVTGRRSDLEQIWRAFSVNATVKQDHPATVAIGNDAAHTWTYASGLASATKLTAAVESVLEMKDAAADAHARRETNQGSGPQ
jgi:protein SCO1/2